MILNRGAQSQLAMRQSLAEANIATPLALPCSESAALAQARKALVQGSLFARRGIERVATCFAESPRYQELTNGDLS